MAHRKHKEVIEAWLNGAQVQHKNYAGQWDDSEQDHPGFFGHLEYRIKPAEPERAVVETEMTADQLFEYFVGAPGGDNAKACIVVANKAIQHALDRGQIVTREEFDRAVGDRKARDMAVSRNLRESLKFVFGNHDGLVWHRIDDDYLESILQRVK